MDREIPRLPDLEPVIIGTIEVRPGDNPLWSSPGMDGPTWRIHEVAKTFFGRSPGWLRKHLRPVPSKSGEARHYVSSEYGTVKPHRSDNGSHEFRLYDIERLAHAFFEHNVIEPERLAYTLKAIRAVMGLWGFDSTAPSAEPAEGDSAEDVNV